MILVSSALIVNTKVSCWAHDLLPFEPLLTNKLPLIERCIRGQAVFELTLNIFISLFTETYENELFMLVLALKTHYVLFLNYSKKH